jgi:hypothetical protein
MRIQGARPEELLDAYVDAVTVINDTPLDDLDLDEV